MTSAAEAREGLAGEVRRAARILVGGIALLWVILLVNQFLLDGVLVRWGIEPRTLRGLRGVLFAPLLHAGAKHLICNTTGLLMLGGLVLLRGERHFWIVTAGGALVGGLGTWLFGRPPMHVGSSILVFAYFGYLATAGWFERRIGTILLSIGALVVWGSLIWGIVPTTARVSWEGHLFGLAGGVLAARMLARK